MFKLTLIAISHIEAILTKHLFSISSINELAFFENQIQFLVGINTQLSAKKFPQLSKGEFLVF
ncbi:MAG: hypothetical protein B6D61_13090 [Bacteroidetes bacterium 4484_249]|nr:MAG: hypothetical protein B6D61_13090 [Bacteroidetes bacterium 4484_249]